LALVKLIFVAVGVDMLLAPYTALANDVSVWFQAVSNGYFGLRLYDRPGFAYPPAVGNLFVSLGRLLRYIHVPISSLYSNNTALRPLVLATQGDYTTLVTSPGMNVMLKIIAIAPQVATGLVIVYAVRRCGGSERRARLAGTAWFLNPLVLVEVGVHAGALDLFVALFSVLAVVLVIDGKPGWAGASLALGILTKLTPLFLAPALVAAVARKRSCSQEAVDVVGVARFIGGGAAAFLVILLPEALVGSLRAMADGALLRAQNGLPGVGGLSLYGLRYFRSFSGITTWTFAHSQGVISATSIVDFGVACAAAVWIFVINRHLDYTVVAASAFVYLVVLMAAPVTNPQYLVWCLPLTIVCAGAWDRSFMPSIVLSAAGCWFYFTLLGPVARLAPLAQYSSVLSIGSLVHLTRRWYTAPAALWGTNYAGDFLGPCVVVALCVMAMLMKQLCRIPQEAPAQAGRPRPGVVSSRGMVRLVAGLIALFAIGGVVAEYPGSGLRGDVRLTSVAYSGGTLGLGVDGTGSSGAATLEFAAVSVAAPTRDRDISIFTDLSYPASGSSTSTILGFPYHLRSEAQLSKYRGTISTIDAQVLATQLRDTARAPRRIIVVLSGAFPRNVLSPATDIVTPWVRAGGVLVWGGDVIGYYSALPHVALNDLDPANLGMRGPIDLLGPASVRLSGDGDSLGTLPSATAQGLGLLYDRTASAVSTNFAITHGGDALGWDDGAFNSIALLPRGAGRYIVFGGGIDSEAVAAQDLMRILSSGVMDSNAPPVFATVRVPAGSGDSTVRVRLSIPESSRYVRLSLLDPSSVGVDSWHWDVVIGGNGATVCPAPTAFTVVCH